MATVVIMPKVDMDQETGTVVEWLKKDGDSVEKDEIILIIETDKVAIDVESPASGILQGIQANPEEVIPVGRTIAYILEPGEQLPDDAKSQDQDLSISSQLMTAAPGVAVTPVAQNIAENHNRNLSNIEGAGSRGKIVKQNVQAALAMTSSVSSDNGGVNATPAARRAARERGVDLEKITGSGPGPRIQAADVWVLVAPIVNIQPASKTGEEVIPLQGMRRTIAERMTTSYQSTPHISFTLKVDMSRFNEVRKQLNTKAKIANQAKVSVTALLVKVVAWALKRHPRLNSSLKDDGIHIFPEFNIGVAVALPEGLIVPVVHNVNQKSVGVIAAEVSDLTSRARQGRLAPIDVAGGTFTISNLGPYGIEQFSAIINPPEAAILAVGATEIDAVVDENGQIVAHPIMRLTLSADHRIVDGAMATHFLRDLREVLESPELVLW